VDIVFADFVTDSQKISKTTADHALGQSICFKFFL